MNTSPSPAGDRLLFLLKRRGPLDAAALARELAITPQAVREQLAGLETAGLVRHQDMVQGRGRPRRCWHLTEASRARFPDTHAELSVALIEAVRAEFGEAGLAQLIARREAATLADYRTRLAVLEGLGERVRALAAIRSEEGYMAECRPTGDGRGYYLIEHHCPICAAARACQGFCRAELAVFQAVLGEGVRVTREAHLLAADQRCVYRVEADQPRGGDHHPAAGHG